MTGSFKTEKEIESYLKSETRELLMPNGSTRVVTAFRVLWENMDDLVAGPLTEQQIIELSLQSQAETGRSFEQSLKSVVGYAIRRWRGYPGYWSD